LLKIFLYSLITFFFTFTFSGFNTDFFVILFKGSQIFSGFGEFSFFHTLTDVPMNEGSLGVHKIELVIKSGEDFGDSSGVGDHANSSHNLSQITSWDNSGWLVVDTSLESSWAPVDELNGSLSLDGGNSGIDILGDDITSVHHAAGHVFTMSRVTFNHHGSGFEDGIGDFSNRELFMVSFFSGDDGGV